MPYDWDKAEKEGGSSGRLPTGIHFTVINRIVTKKAGGAPMMSKNKDPMILVVFSNDAGEATRNYTLSEKAGGFLAALLSRAGVDLPRLRSEGIEPHHFKDKAIAEQYLLNRECWIKVEPAADPKYQDVTPLHEKEALAEDPKCVESRDLQTDPFK